ncbi:MAG: hypothetical protein CO021_06110 [Deltaproteobacteria bacterium CG_4_9_14_0_2_um_filter_42_21]|nr:MAG: hypothetical protein CO021_06110 [Deltaproteobacteria bacterium CG_4_9_14_0_2_um_filter_42_21]
MHVAIIPPFLRPYLGSPDLNVANLASSPHLGPLLKFTTAFCTFQPSAPCVVHVQARRFAVALASRYNFVQQLTPLPSGPLPETPYIQFIQEQFLPSFRGAAASFFTSCLVRLPSVEHPALDAAVHKIDSVRLSNALTAGLLEQAAVQVFFETVLKDAKFVQDVADGNIELDVDDPAAILARMRQLLNVAPHTSASLRAANTDASAPPLAAAHP